jgi:hypothetical protein
MLATGKSALTEHVTDSPQRPCKGKEINKFPVDQENIKTAFSL